MLTAVVTSSGSSVEVTLVEGILRAADEEDHAEEGTESEHAVPEKDLNPIFPEVKEVIWGFGSFVVLALVLRLFLFRKVRDGMTARYDRIQGDFADAESITAAARSDVADYNAQVAAARAEAQQQVEAARATLEAERSAKLAEVNARIAEKRAAAAADVEAARQAAQGDVAVAVADVAALAGRLATGKAPSFEVVAATVREITGEGVPA